MSIIAFNDHNSNVPRNSPKDARGSFSVQSRVGDSWAELKEPPSRLLIPEENELWRLHAAILRKSHGQVFTAPCLQWWMISFYLEVDLVRRWLGMALAMARERNLCLSRERLLLQQWSDYSRNKTKMIDVDSLNIYEIILKLAAGAKTEPWGFICDFISIQYIVLFIQRTGWHDNSKGES